LGQFWWAVAALVGKNSCYGLGKFLMDMEQFGGLVVIDGQGKQSINLWISRKVFHFKAIDIKHFPNIPSGYC
jgi:hypothetical protein